MYKRATLLFFFVAQVFDDGQEEEEKKLLSFPTSDWEAGNSDTIIGI